MTESKPPDVTPMLAYDDAAGAIAFLIDAFGFEERMRYEMPDGSIGHAEVALGDGVVAIATTWAAAGFSTPRELGAVHAQIYAVVPDVDAHYARACAKGAVVLNAPVDQPYGARSYRALDPEGHRWIFSTPFDDTRPEGARDVSQRPSSAAAEE